MGALQLWAFSGRTGRKNYLLIGIIAFLLKSNIDRVLATYFFHRPWGLLNYWFPFPAVAEPWLLSETDAYLGLTLLAVSLPFIWLGVAQTVRRLRDCEAPVWMCALFFVPFVNLIYFAVLCCWPSANRKGVAKQAPPERGGLAGFLTNSRVLRAAILAIVATAVIGIAAVYVSTEYQGAYGWGLFVAVPFCLGLFSTMIYSYRTPRTIGECLLISLAPMFLLAVGLLLLASEGVLCILMAAPLGLGLSALGGIAGFSFQAARWMAKGRPVMMGIVLAVMPLGMSLSPSFEGQPPQLIVVSSIEINASPEVVWKKVVAFTQISENREWLFHTGIAYPIRATLTGEGVGAVRRCEFSTGAFVEPIEIWDEPRLLRFAVTENPAPMEELSPYHHLETPHLQGYFVSHQGQFELTRLPGNRTRITGTTWYTDRIWPSAYWQIWSDYIIHRIHLRVLRHIEAEAERVER